MGILKHFLYILFQQNPVVESALFIDA